MLGWILAVLGLALLCGSWVVVQRFVAKHDPDQPGVENRCGTCGSRAFKRPR